MPDEIHALPVERAASEGRFLSEMLEGGSCHPAWGDPVAQRWKRTRGKRKDRNPGNRGEAIRRLREDD